MERLPKIREQQVEVAFVDDVPSRGALKKSKSVVSFGDAGRGDGAGNNFYKHMESRKTGTGILQPVHEQVEEAKIGARRQEQDKRHSLYQKLDLKNLAIAEHQLDQLHSQSTRALLT